MRAAHTALGVVLLGSATLLVAVGNRIVSRPAHDVSVAPSVDAPAQPDAVEPGTAKLKPASGPTTGLTLGPTDDPARWHARAIDPELIAPPAVAADELERVEPRPPLSELALAGPPKPKPKLPKVRDGTTLFEPLASAAGRIEAKGYVITIAGTDIVGVDEICTDSAGKSWNCGIAARSAFRAFLGRRAVVCALPPQGGPQAATVSCRRGAQDIGAWLVTNGWARARADGPYRQAGETAEEKGKGIFGPAPDLSDLPPPPPPVEITTPAAPSILDLSGTAATPPVDQPEPAR